MAGSGSSIKTASRAEGLIQSIGVNTHLGWLGTPLANISLNLSDIAYLGIDHVRDLAPVGYMLPAYKRMAAQGIKFDLIASDYDQDVEADLPASLALMNQLEEADPGSIYSIEGPNEVNSPVNNVSYGGASAADPNAFVADEIMQAISASVQADSTLKNIPIINLSLSNGVANWQAYLAAMGNMATDVNEGNWHVYFDGGAQPGAVLNYMIPFAQESAPGEPVTITESGYSTAYLDTSGWGGVDQLTQAKNTLNLLADAYQDGVQTTYLYDLMDEIPNPSLTDIADAFGLFNSDGTPKLAATAVHNLTSILADPASNALTFATGNLAYSIPSLPALGNSMLLEKANGIFDIMVWAEPRDWNSESDTEIQVPVTNTMVNLGATYQTVKVYDPLLSAAPIITLTDVASVVLGLTDHPLIIEVDKNPVSTTYTPGAIGGIVTAKPTFTPPWLPPAGTTNNFAVSDQSTTGQYAGGSGQSEGTPYSGPVTGLTSELIAVTTDSINITATAPNVFISLDGGSGEDAIAVNRANGNNVLNGSTGSSFLYGGTGNDTFFVDDRNPPAGSDIWSTVVGFHSGDAATIWGVTPSDFTLSWVDGQGATGYTGLTLHATAPGVPTASVTLAGLTSADVTNGTLTVSFGTTAAIDGVPGSAYMYVHDN